MERTCTNHLERDTQNNPVPENTNDILNSGRLKGCVLYNNVAFQSRVYINIYTSQTHMHSVTSAEKEKRKEMLRD